MALILEGLYVAAANALLASGEIERLASSGESVKVRFRRATSFWPGRVHLEDFEMTMQDRNVQVLLQMKKADVNVDLSALTRRTFHATRVRGEGVVYRMRMRRNPRAATRPRVSALPPIPGFSDPPLREAGPPPPPIDEAHYKLWTVHIDDADVGVREIWVEYFRFQGEARATGAFRLRPQRRVWVGPAELVVSSGDVTAGRYDALSAVKGRIDCRVDDFNVRAFSGTQVFRNISSRVQLRGQVPGLEEIQFLFAPTDVSINAAGPLDADVRFEHGVVTQDTRVAFQTQHIAVARRDLRFHVDGALSAGFALVSKTGPGLLTASVSKAALHLDGSPYPPARIEALEALSKTTTVDLTSRWDLSDGEVRLGEARVPDLRWLNGLHWVRSLGWTMLGGEANAKGAVAVSREGDVRGWANASVLRGSARRGQIGVEASGDAHVVMFARRSRLVDGDLRIEAHDVRAGALGSANKPWAAIDTAAISGHLAAGEREATPATRELRANLGFTRFRWGAFAADLERTTFAGQWNPGWMQSRIDGTGLLLRNAGGAPRSWQAEVASTSVDAVLAETGDKVGGNLRVEVHQANGQVGHTELRGDIVAQLATATPARIGPADLSGVILASNVALLKDQHRIDGWWAQVDLAHLRLGFGEKLDVEARGRARVQNGLPVLYLVSSPGKGPNWLLAQLARTTLNAELEVDRSCGFTDLRIPRVRGGLLWLEGRVQSEPGRTYGAMLFRLAGIKPLSLGVAFYENEMQSTPFVGSGWLEQRIAPMSDVAAQKRAPQCGGARPP